MYKNTVAHYVTKVLVDIMFYGGNVCVAAVPWLTKYLCFLLDKPADSQFYYITSAILFASGICAVFILMNLKQMFQTLLGGNPFVEKNISAFRRMAAACGVISFIFTIKCFLLFSLATVIIVLVFAIGALFCLTLKDIFKQAMYYKEEHDWTV